MAQTLIHEAGEEKQPGRAEPQINHGNKAALYALKIQGEHADNHKSQMADAAKHQ